MKDFFSGFESYFANKYEKDDYGQSQLLGEFLKDELLQVYDAMGGRSLKYSSMKTKLISHYKKMKVGGKSYWKHALQTSMPHSDEPYDIFGMRLSELAKRAYPGDSTELKRQCAKELRKAFLSNLPDYIVEQIETTERSLKAASAGRQKVMNFAALTEFARDLQFKEPKPTSVMWTSAACSSQPSNERTKVFKPSQPEKNKNNENQSYNKRRGGTPDKHSKNAAPRTSSSPSPRPRCSFCGYEGHTRNKCWREGGLCLICGGQHHIEKCPKYDPNRRRRDGHSSPVGKKSGNC